MDYRQPDTHNDGEESDDELVKRLPKNFMKERVVEKLVPKDTGEPPNREKRVFIPPYLSSMRRNNVPNPTTDGTYFDVVDDANQVPEEVRQRYGAAMENDEARTDAIKGKALVGEAAEKLDRENMEAKWGDHRIATEEVVDYTLQDDAFKISGQGYVCISVIFKDQYKVLHTGDGTYSGNLIKIRGVFRMRENADTFIRTHLLKEDPEQRVILARMFSWTILDDDWDGDDVGEAAMEDIKGALEGYFENENERIKELQRRINRVQGPVKALAKDTREFFNEANELAERAKEEKEMSKRVTQAAKSMCLSGANVDEVYETYQNRENEETPPVMLQLGADKSRIKGQAWACLSYISDSAFQNPKKPASFNLRRPIVKVRGVFPDIKQAEAFIRHEIQPRDNRIDVFVVPCFQWATLDDENIENQDYMDDGAVQGMTLRGLISEYRDNKNDRISETPQQRVRDAKKRQLEMIASGEIEHDSANLPPDVAALPRIDEKTARHLRAESRRDPTTGKIILPSRFLEKFSITVDEAQLAKEREMCEKGYMPKVMGDVSHVDNERAVIGNGERGGEGGEAGVTVMSLPYSSSV
jgi:hypothetical protein